MKTLALSPLSAPVRGTVSVPGSKSYTNRALLLAAMTGGPVRIMRPLLSDDTQAMLSCLRALGIEIIEADKGIIVRGDVSSVDERDYDLDADLSGTTIRFMTALCALLPGRQRLHGKAGLEARPIGELVDVLRQLGAQIEYLGRQGYPPLLVAAPQLRSTSVKLSGATSSQYLSALLMAAPLANGLTIEVTDGLISQPYVEMTLAVMRQFGVSATVAKNTYHVSTGQHYTASEYTVEGDVSSACYFFAVAALTGSTITVQNLNPRSLQADMRFLKILEQLGSQVAYGEHAITVIGRGIEPLDVDMQECPDQAQTLAVLAAFAAGTTTITGIGSLRIKETERIVALEQELAKMGIKTESTADSLTIRGGQPHGASIATHGDHRMAMAFAVAGARLPDVIIEDPSVVSKTFPDFWKVLASLGVAAKKEVTV